MDPTIIFTAKAIILIEALTHAIRSWVIFKPLRLYFTSRFSFSQRLLACFECTAVWVSFFVIPYLIFFDWKYFTFLIILPRLAVFLNIGYNLLDALRAFISNRV